MLRKIEEIFSIPDLRKKILMTLLLLAIFRLGTHIPTPGINGDALSQFFADKSGNLLGFFDMFTGGALQKMTVFGLGVMPYISASIILELMTAVVPHLAELKKRGTEGREKITRYTRYLTVFISMFQGLAIAIGMQGMTAPDGAQVVMYAGSGVFAAWRFRVITALTLTTGTIFLMWLGEKITSFGVGNGMSLIIMAGIIASFPSALIRTGELALSDMILPTTLIGALAVMAASLVAIVFMETSQRRIPIQYVRKASIGGRMQSSTSYLPLRLNPAGVIPIIFASTIVTLPPTVATFVKNPAIAQVASYFSPNHWFYYVLEFVFIIFFTYFYTSIIFNPNDIAENIQKSGGVIPGKRPGAATGGYIDYVLSRLTFVGAIYLAIVAILPQLIITAFKMPFYFGGTSILIVVGVGLDVIQKIEAHLITNNYEGFLKKGRIRGRYSQ